MYERPVASVGTKPLAIHNGSNWNERWIRYCRERSIPHKVVNCFDSDVLDQIKECGGLMWMLRLDRPQDMLVGRHVLNAAKLMGLKVFPDFPESWHYDDKLAQKYLFEALGLPTPRAWAFFEETRALQFIERCDLPVVAKLRHGASSSNVRLLRTRREGRSYVRRMFGRGISPVPAPWANAKQRIKVALAVSGISRTATGLKGAPSEYKVALPVGGVNQMLIRLKRAPRVYLETVCARRNAVRERGYLYLQEFIPGNTCDYRLMIVGNKCWGYRRMVRAGDFRASGSHFQDPDHTKITDTMIQTAFASAERLGMRSVGIDFVMDHDRPLIVEISCCYGIDEWEYEGFWDRNLHWHEERVDPRDQIVEEMVRELKKAL